MVYAANEVTPEYAVTPQDAQARADVLQSTSQAVTTRDATNTDFLAETHEALKLLIGETDDAQLVQLLASRPQIHFVDTPAGMPGGQLFKMYQFNTGRDAVLYQTQEAWLHHSKIIDAWYLFVTFGGE